MIHFVTAFPFEFFLLKGQKNLGEGLIKDYFKAKLTNQNVFKKRLPMAFDLNSKESIEICRAFDLTNTYILFNKH